jgi:hypothetical protein
VADIDVERRPRSPLVWILLLLLLLALGYLAWTFLRGGGAVDPAPAVEVDTATP